MAGDEQANSASMGSQEIGWEVTNAAVVTGACAPPLAVFANGCCAGRTTVLQQACEACILP